MKVKIFPISMCNIKYMNYGSVAISQKKNFVGKFCDGKRCVKKNDVQGTSQLNFVDDRKVIAPLSSFADEENRECEKSFHYIFYLKFFVYKEIFKEMRCGHVCC